MRDLQSYVDEEYRKAPEEAVRLYDGKSIEEAGNELLVFSVQSSGYVRGTGLLSDSFLVIFPTPGSSCP